MDTLKSVVVWIVSLSFMVLFFPLTFIIWLLLLPFDRERAFVHWSLVYQSVFLTWVLPIWKADIRGRDKIRKGTTYVIISNHQSMLDTILINNIRYRYKWISKIENEKVPFIGWYLKMADYISVNRGDELSKQAMLEKSLNCLHRGTSIMIFPEGTRSRDNEIGFYKRGAFQLAMQANVAILPVLIDGTGGILPKHGLRIGNGYQINIRILDPIIPASFGTENPDELAKEIHDRMASELKSLRGEYQGK